jgi:hypothetical protein
MKIKLKIIGVAFGVVFGVLHLQAQSTCMPNISLAGQVSNKITPINLKKCKELMVRCHDGDSVVWKILSYRVVLVPKKRDATVSNNNGSEFSNETLNQLARTRKDDVIFFEDIRIVDDRGKESEFAMVLEVY